jgi:hypothetical protein
MSLSAITKSNVQALATEFGVDPSVIAGLIQYESGWNPQAKNPNSTSKGLIQFVDSTAQSLGFQDSQDLVNQFPDVDSQLLGPVADYWRKYAPYNSQEEFILAVFYPAWRAKSLDTELPQSVKDVNPGIDTLGDYVSNVEKHMSAFAVVKEFLSSGTGEISATLLLLLAIGGYMLFHK